MLMARYSIAKCSAVKPWLAFVNASTGAEQRLHLPVYPDFAASIRAVLSK
jgi:hypothetical protein